MRNWSVIVVSAIIGGLVAHFGSVFIYHTLHRAALTRSDCSIYGLVSSSQPTTTVVWCVDINTGVVYDPIVLKQLDLLRTSRKTDPIRK